MVLLFVNIYVLRWLDDYGVGYVKLSPYDPQANGQVEVSNKTLLRVLNKMI